MKKIKVIGSILLMIAGFAPHVAAQTFKNLNGETISKQEMDQFIKHQMDSLNIVGLSIAVIEENKIAYTNTFGFKNYYTKEPITSNTLFEAASLSKPVIGVFTLKLIEEGLLDLNTPLHSIIPFEELSEDERSKSMTTEMILSHTTGLPNWRWQMEDGQLDFIEEPGEVFTYSGEAYMYLSKVLAEITNTDLSTLDDVFYDRITTPLGIDDFYYGIDDEMWPRMANAHWNKRFVHDNNWDRTQFNSPGGLYSEPSSYAEFVVKLFSGKIISDESLQAFTNSYISVYPEYEELTGISEWGLGIGLISSDKGLTIAHGGNNFGYTAGFAYNIDSGFGYVLMTNSDQVSNVVYALEDLLLPGIKSNSK